MVNETEKEKKIDLKAAAYFAFALRKQQVSKPVVNTGKLKVCVAK